MRVFEKSRLQILVNLAAFAIFIVSNAHGQVVFSDDFDADATNCSTLSPNWTSSDPNLGEIGTFTSNSNACSVFTRGGAVTVTSIPFNMSAAIGGELSAWVQKGDDSFSEDPDASAESLNIDFLDMFGNWIALASFDPVLIPDGAITEITVPLPVSAFHSALQIRIRQEGGSAGPPANGGIGFDFWHTDDIVVRQTVATPVPPNLTANSCDNFELGVLNNWKPTNVTRVGVSSATANSPTQSMFIRHTTATVTSIPLNAVNLTEISMWVQRGADAFSENPEPGDDLIFEYLNDVGAWIPLETFTGAGTPGEILIRTFPAPADARHTALQVRFNYPLASGADFDYWHVDDVCFVSGVPSISANQAVSLFADPFSGAGGYYIPGSIAEYEIIIENSGDGAVDADTITLVEQIDANSELFVGDLNGSGSPFIVTDGGGVSGLTLDFGGLGDGGDGVVFRNASNASITPTPDFDEAITSFELSFDGAFNGTTTTTPRTVSVRYRTRVK